MKSYYVCRRETHDKYIGLYRGSFYESLDNGAVLMCAEFKRTQDQDAFEKELDVIAFPHPLDHPAQPVGFSIAAKCEKFGLDKDHTTFRAAMTLKQHHHLFDPRHTF